VIVVEFGPDDLARCRFAISPLWETVGALAALHRPSGAAAHLPWLQAAGERLAGLDVRPLLRIVESAVYVPDFITPPPESPSESVEEELERVRATSRERAATELGWAFKSRTVGPTERAMLDDPSGAVQQLADLMHECWHRLLADDWPRVRDILEADILHRARLLTSGGMERVLDDLHPDVSWQRQTLRVRKRVEQRVPLEGRGLLFVPSAFTWPDVLLVTDPPWQPTIIYPARGVAQLWERTRVSGPELEALLGRTRALVLAGAVEPVSTTRLAARLSLPVGTVSDHLGVLSRAGLVRSARAGRQVLYAATPVGHALLAAK
jgi:hypothetical protein